MKIDVRAGAWVLGSVATAITLGTVWRRRRARGASHAEARSGPPPRGDHPGWHTAGLASLDFETTGVDPARDRVLSYALLDDTGDDLCGLINPGIPIPAASAAVHGLSEAIIATAPPPEVGLVAVLEAITSLIDRQIGLVVFNAAYDLTMLRAEADRWNLDQPEWDRLLVVDPYVIDWGIERGARRGPRRLVDVAAYYEVDIDHAHDAECDATAARDVAYEMGRRHRAIGTLPLPELMHRQREWYAARVEDWNAYAARVGRTVDEPTGWPLAGTLASDRLTA